MTHLRQPEVSYLIKALRNCTGLTQERLAAKIGVSFSTLNKWERGKANPVPLALRRIEEVLYDMGPDGEELLGKYFPNREY